MVLTYWPISRRIASSPLSIRRFASSRPRRCEIVTVTGSTARTMPGKRRAERLGPDMGCGGGEMAEIRVRSEIAGSVWKIEVAVGDAVAADEPLIILESMKMEIPLLAPRAGVVKEILVAEIGGAHV